MDQTRTPVSPSTDTTPAEATHEPTNEQYQAGRTLGVVARIHTREKGFIFFRDEANSEYFAHKSGFSEDAAFYHAQIGDGVSFRVSKGSKGQRAFDVVRATEEELMVIRDWEEQRGNR